MKKYLLAPLLLSNFFSASGQKLSIVPHAGISYYGFSYFPDKNSLNGGIKTPVPNIAPVYGADIIYKPGRIAHKLGLQRVTLGATFSTTFKNPNNGFQTRHTSQDGIDHWLLSYSLQMESQKLKKIIGMKFKFAGSLGVGVGLNESKWYYDNYYGRDDVGWSFSNGSFLRYSLDHQRRGPGLFLVGSGGIDFYNKKGKNNFSMSLFVNKGLNEMARFNMDITTGQTSNPGAAVTRHYTFATRGTNVGIKIGVPIRILK
jgi:hypothetical protein